jgi:5-methylcytosine-specific restriction enzyme A
MAAGLIGALAGSCIGTLVYAGIDYATMTKRLIRERPTRVKMTDTRRVKPIPKVTRGERRPGPFDGLYQSARWKAFAKALIKQRGRECQDPACTKPDFGRGEMMFCDHGIELKDGGDPFDASQIVLRCGSCHTRKTAAERLRRQGPW